MIDFGHDGELGTRDGDKIVPLKEYRTQAQKPIIAQLEAYWESLRKGRLLPARTDIDPRGLDGILEHIFILERIAPGMARFRLSGSHLSDLMGLEMRGMPTSAVFVPISRAALSEVYESVFDGPAVVRLQLEAEGGIGRPRLFGEMILMPLRSDLGDVSRAVGAIVMEGDVGRQPRRLSVIGKHQRLLLSKQDTNIPTESPARQKDVQSEPAKEMPASSDSGAKLRPALDGEGIGERAHGHLRLVSDRSDLKN